MLKSLYISTILCTFDSSTLKNSIMKCTNCKKETDQLRTEHKHNTPNGFIDLIPKGEKWCVDCVKLKGLKTLKDYNNELERQV